jgi:hypothetical protein
MYFGVNKAFRKRERLHFVLLKIQILKFNSFDRFKLFGPIQNQRKIQENVSKRQSFLS